ncbi:MAG TPA: hypothetical protein VI072_04305, partial [Polyangiaceae bacterium]
MFGLTGSAWRGLSVLLFWTWLVSALPGCSTNEFAATPAPDGGAGSGGTGGGTGRACTGPEDCDDSNPCTVEQCGADGKCAASQPKCGSALKCCDGVCG